MLLAVLPAGDPQAAVAELNRAVTTLGLRVCCERNTTNFLMAFSTNLEAAAALDVPVFSPHDSASSNESLFYNQWLTLHGILSSAGYGWHMMLDSRYG